MVLLVGVSHRNRAKLGQKWAHRYFAFSLLWVEWEGMDEDIRKRKGR